MRFSQHWRQARTKLTGGIDVRRQVDVLSLIVPLAISIVGIKVYKVVFALYPGRLGDALWQAPSIVDVLLTPPTLVAMGLCVLAVAAAWILRRRGRLGRTGVAVLTVAALALPIITLVITLSGHSVGVPADGWSVRTFIRHLRRMVFAMRADFFTIAVAGLIALLVIRFDPTRRCRYGYGVLAVLALTAALLLGMDLAGYQSTGLNGSASLIGFVISTLLSNPEVILSEFHLQNQVQLAIPVVLVAAGICARNLIRRSPKLGERGAGPVALVVAVPLFASVIPPLYFEEDLVRLTSNVLVRLSGDLVVSPIRRLSARERPLVISIEQDLNTRLVATNDVQKMNVVLVILESIRASAVGIYNPALRTTPFLDSIRDTSLVAQHFYASVPRTSATWVSAIHGTYPSTMATMTLWSATVADGKRRPTAGLPSLLREHGYSSAFFVPTHTDFQQEGTFLDGMRFDHIVKASSSDSKSFINYFGHADEWIIPPLFSWIDAQRRDNRPFMATVMTNVGHHKYEHPRAWSATTYGDGRNQDYENYLRCVAYIDHHLSRIHAGLRERNLLDSTALIVVGDHGEAFGEHGFFEHGGSIHEESMRVPFLIHAAGKPDVRGEVPGIWHHADILPTIADLLGFTLEAAPSAGRSVLKAQEPNRTVFFSGVFEEFTVGLRRGNRKFIYNFDRTPTELYDLAADPTESTNLAGRTEAETIAELTAEALSWSESVRDWYLGVSR